MTSIYHVPVRGDSLLFHMYNKTSLKLALGKKWSKFSQYVRPVQLKKPFRTCQPIVFSRAPAFLMSRKNREWEKAHRYKNRRGCDLRHRWKPPLEQRRCRNQGDCTPAATDSLQQILALAIMIFKIVPTISVVGTSFNADPYLAFHLHADPDLKILTHGGPCGSGSWSDFKGTKS